MFILDYCTETLKLATLYYKEFSCIYWENNKSKQASCIPRINLYPTLLLRTELEKYSSFIIFNPLLKRIYFVYHT